MHYIDSNVKSISDGLACHYLWARCFIRKKAGCDRCSDKNCITCKSNMKKVLGVPVELKKLIEDDLLLYTIICGMPAEIQREEEKVMSTILGIETERRLVLSACKSEKLSIEDKKDKSQIAILYKIIKSVFYYDYFLKLGPDKKYSMYHLSKALDRNSCTYCNRSYTSTMVTRNNKKLMRPQFDHWFPQSSRPLLALSFFNLVPSCGICNSAVKGSVLLNLNDYVHPYVDRTQAEEFYFSYDFNESIDEFSISLHGLKEDGRALKTAESFKIEQMFNAHHSELREMINLQRAYPKSYIEQMRFFLPGDISNGDVYRMLFGTEAESEDFHKRPLSKFKSDILKELGILD